MHPDDSQGELLPREPSPPAGPQTLEEVRDFFAREAVQTAEAIGAMKRTLEVQGALVLGALLAGLVLSASINILTAKQMSMVRDQVQVARPRVLRMQTDFREQREPTLHRVVGQLQAYASTNRDFAPILEKYRPFLQKYFTGPAVPAPVPPTVQPPGAAARPPKR